MKRTDEIVDTGTRLVPVTLADRNAVENIRLDPHQEPFAGSIAAVFDELKNSKHPQLEHLFVIADAQENVGFFVLKEKQAAPEWAPSSAITLHSLRIRTTSQGKGFGRISLALAVRWIEQNRPHVRHLALAVNARNAPAIALYRKCGFIDTGAHVSGPIGRQCIFSFHIRSRKP